ncbi:hypothetical protein BDZ94DRAFT_1300308 [Collybia nuda]|uniref:Uncharacterized protein n=1 Tax=Collybia nuda TaxID=64659 RepID=A0A9P6CGC4_9AGAR|nr:hypothetical protein BDZ94DRAFT_1300308 [Collybia nuda]
MFKIPSHHDYCHAGCKYYDQSYWPGYGTFTITVDGRVVNTGDGNHSQEIMQVLGSVSGLEHGPHTAIFTNNGGSPTDIDVVEVDSQVGLPGCVTFRFILICFKSNWFTNNGTSFSEGTLQCLDHFRWSFKIIYRRWGRLCIGIVYKALSRTGLVGQKRTQGGLSQSTLVGASIGGIFGLLILFGLVLIYARHTSPYDPEIPNASGKHDGVGIFAALHYHTQFSLLAACKTLDHS